MFNQFSRVLNNSVGNSSLFWFKIICFCQLPENSFVLYCRALTQVSFCSLKSVSASPSHKRQYQCFPPQAYTLQLSRTNLFLILHYFSKTNNSSFIELFGEEELVDLEYQHFQFQARAARLCRLMAQGQKLGRQREAMLTGELPLGHSLILFCSKSVFERTSFSLSLSGSGSSVHDKVNSEVLVVILALLNCHALK